VPLNAHWLNARRTSAGEGKRGPDQSPAIAIGATATAVRSVTGSSGVGARLDLDQGPSTGLSYTGLIVESRK
jgi:hypothetical protein